MALFQLRVLKIKSSEVKNRKAMTKDARVAPANQSQTYAHRVEGKRTHKQHLQDDIELTVYGRDARILCAYKAKNAGSQRPGRKCTTIEVIHCDHAEFTLIASEQTTIS